MLVKVFGAAVQGIDALVVTIEVNCSQGIRFFMVGLPDAAVKESHERIVSAVEHNGYRFPRKQVIVNMSPADIRKEGAAYDLPLAVGILNEKDIAADAAQACKEIEQGKLLVDSGRSLIEAGLQKTRSLAEEYVLRAKALMTDYAEPRRFELACHAYEQGIELTRANLSEEELAKVCLSMVVFYRQTNDTIWRKFVIEKI